MEKKNILITGATSTIGRQVVQQFYFDKNVGVVIGVAKEDKPYYFNDLNPTRFIYKNMNILKTRELNNLFLSQMFKEANINTVVHLAFINRLDKADISTHVLNVDGTKNLIDRCLETGNMTKFVFKSSDAVYKLKHSNPVLLDENADLNFDPDADPWVKDRVDADMICRSKMDNKKMGIVILRTSNIIGRNVHSQLNSYFDSKVVFKLLGFNPMINLVHSRDVIRAMQMAIHKNVRGVFNIAGTETAPISKFVELNGGIVISMPSFMLAGINKVQRALRMTDYYYSVDKDRMKYSCLLDTSKAREVLGFSPKNRIKFG
jgi:UDP-glucose 4-epimerase